MTQSEIARINAGGFHHGDYFSIKNRSDMVFILKTSKSWMKTLKPPPAKISSLKLDHNQSCPHGQLLPYESSRKQNIPTGPVFVKEIGFFLHDSFQGEMATDYPLGAAAEVHADEKWRGVRGSQTCGSEGTQAAEGCRTSFHPLPVTSSRGTSPATCSFSPARCNTRQFAAAYQTSHSTYTPKSSGKMTWMQDRKILIQKSLQGSMKTNSTGQVWLLYKAFFFHFMVGKHREYMCQPCLNPDTLQGSLLFLK